MKWWERQELAEFARFSGDPDPSSSPDTTTWWERALAWFIELLAGK